VSVADVIKDKPIVNVSGCPPIPVVITAVLTQYVTFGTLPELDALGRPKAFYGQTIHDRCYRRPFYERGQFADSFDDEGARLGWCLYKLGCRGPTTYNACATVKWNNGTSFPIEAGHGCIGCAEPGFWDNGGFYRALSTGNWGSARTVGTAIGVGAALGIASAVLARKRQRDAEGA
jgi:hydrogenase small subunit